MKNLYFTSSQTDAMIRLTITAVCAIYTASQITILPEEIVEEFIEYNQIIDLVEDSVGELQTDEEGFYEAREWYRATYQSRTLCN